MEGRPGNDLDLSAIASRIKMRFLPDELSFVPQSSVIVSTVHRAKGLEFDRTFLVGLERVPEDANLEEETRLLYVAATRARDEIYVVGQGDHLNIRSRGQEGNRWVRFGRTQRPEAVELRAEDVHSMDPAGAYLVEDGDARDTQSYLANSVREGDCVTLLGSGRRSTVSLVPTTVSTTRALRSELRPKGSRLISTRRSDATAVSAVSHPRSAADTCMPSKPSGAVALPHSGRG